MRGNLSVQVHGSPPYRKLAQEICHGYLQPRRLLRMRRVVETPDGS